MITTFYQKMKELYLKICFIGCVNLLVMGGVLTPTMAQIGQSQIEDTKIIVKVSDIEDDVTSDNQFITPDEGNRFLAVQVIVDNTQGDKTTTANPLFFKLKDGEGNQYDVEMVGVKEPALGSGDVDAGDLVKGWLTFQVPESAEIESIRLRYEAFFQKSGWINLSGEPPTQSTEKSESDHSGEQQVVAETTGAQAVIEDTKVIIRVSGIEDDVTSDNQFITPDEGNRFLAVQVIVDNTQGDKTTTANPLFFKLKDGEGNQYTVEMVGVMEPALSSGDVDTGDLVKGWLTFQVPESVEIESIRLRYEAFFQKSGWINLSEVED